MKFKTYKEASEGLEDEHLEIFDNILLPVLTGQSLVHIRTHEESRLVGICETISSRVSDKFRVLHVLTEAGVESSILLDSGADDEDFSKLNIGRANDETSANIHTRALDSFLSSNEGGILLVMGADSVCRRNDFIRRLKIHAKQGLFAENDDDETNPKLVILHTISADTPDTLSRTIQNYDLPMPRDGTLTAVVKGVCYDSNIPQLEAEIQVQWVRALRGLTSIEAGRALTQALTVHNNAFNDDSLLYLQSLKRNLIQQTGIMEFHEPSTSFQDIGGLDFIIEDLKMRRSEFELDAQDAGIKAPKGCLLVGLPGTGKSLIAQSVAGEWHLPMLEFNMANVLDGLVGASEQNIKKVLAVAESMAPCVLMVDEIDKALTGLGSGGGDSGVTRRVIGSFLTWLNDRKSHVYVIATANDLQEIATAMPEMLRKGRWDDIWWVDLPGKDTRRHIIDIHLGKIPSNRIEKSVWDAIDSFSNLNEGITGAELASAVNEANRLSFHEGKLLNIEQLEKSISSIKPLASGIRGLNMTRQWMKDFARPASSFEPAKIKSKPKYYLSGLDAARNFIPSSEKSRNEKND
jgi:ATP-dependent 26S proteasome regulatory subunit